MPNGKLSKLNRIQKHERLMEMFQALTETEFTGYIKVNFSQGTIAKIEKFEEVALHKDRH